MNDIKRINRAFLLSLLALIAAIAVLAFGMIAVNVWVANENTQYVLYFITLLVSLFVIAVFKAKLERVTQLSFLIKIRAHQGEPLPMRHTRDMDDMNGHLKRLGYEPYAHDLSHALYCRVTKDQIKRIFRRYMLEVVVLVDARNQSFYLEQVDHEIAKIQQDYLKESKKMDRMLITQIKEIGVLDDATKEAIKEIIFVRSNQTVVSTINVGLYRPQGVAVMLYSDTYHPSLYYVHHIEEIKKII